MEVDRPILQSFRDLATSMKGRGRMRLLCGTCLYVDAAAFIREFQGSHFVRCKSKLWFYWKFFCFNSN